MFLIVGLAAASIVLFLFFFIKRRHRNRRLEYDTAVASTLAAAGYNRQPLDGDDYDEGGGMRQRRRSSPSALATVSSLGTQAAAVQPYTDDPTGRRAEFDPYSAYSAAPPQTPPASARRDGYVPARTSSPPLGHSHSASTSSMGHVMGGGGHIPRESAGSFEPLLAAAGGSAPSTPGPVAPSTSAGPPPAIPPKSPRRSPRLPSDDGHHPVPRDSASSVYSQPDGEAEDQLVDLTPRQPLEVRRRARCCVPSMLTPCARRCATCLMDSAPARTFRGKRRGARSPARSPRHDISRSTCVLHGGPVLPYAVLALAYYPPSPS